MQSEWLWRGMSDRRIPGVSSFEDGWKRSALSGKEIASSFAIIQAVGIYHDPKHFYTASTMFGRISGAACSFFRTGTPSVFARPTSRLQSPLHLVNTSFLHPAGAVA